MIPETTHQYNGQQLHSITCVTDTDLVLLLAGLTAARSILQHKRYSTGASGFLELSTYYTRMLNEMGTMHRQLSKIANQGHIIEATLLTKTLIQP